MRHLDEARMLLEAQERQYRDRRHEVLAAASGELLRGLADRERADNTEASALAPKVRRLVARRVEDLRLVADILQAVDQKAGVANHPSRSERVRRSVDVGLLLDAAEADVTLLRPQEIVPPASRQAVVMADPVDWGLRGVGQADALGFVVGGSFGNVDRAPLVSDGRRPGEI